jgi:hypothetical protein
MTDNIAEAVRIARRVATMLPVLVQLGACSPAPPTRNGTELDCNDTC